jgi:transcription-repair coupling factor (superfamily II helicase)
MSPVESMSRILSMAQKDPVFQKILEELREPVRSHINVTGMTDSQKAYLISAVCRETGQKPVILVPDELRARMLQMDLSAFCEEDVLILRQRELNLADVDASSRDAELSRIGVLSRLLRGDFGAVIITAGALMNRLMPASDFSNTQVNLCVGMRVSPEDLSMRLVNIGYERQRKVEGE